MSLTDDQMFDWALTLGRGYEHLRDVFMRFCDGAKSLADPAARPRNVGVSHCVASDWLEVAFAGFLLRFSFFVTYHDQRHLVGRVVVERREPTFSDSRDVIGTFDFDLAGTTFLSTPDGVENLSCTYNAEKIVWYFFQQAVLTNAHLETP